MVNSSVARVYQTAGTADHESTAFACNYRTGRRFQLDHPNTNTPNFLAGTDDAGQRPKLAGRFLVFILDVSAGADDSQSIVIVDLKSGRFRALGNFTDSDGLISQFVVNRAGAVAFGLSDVLMRPQSVNQILIAAAGHSPQVAASSPSVDDRSLAISPDRRSVTWIEGGQARSAPLGGG